jgi:hypothetical protein
MRETHHRTEDVMAKYESGMKVGGGYYWNASTWSVAVIPNEGGKLEGGPGARYLKVPFPVLFVIVPTMGALLLMFLPLIGFALLAYAIAKKLAAGLTRGTTELAATVHPGSFAPGSAYFTGKPEEKNAAAEAPESAELDALEREIADRKGERK